MTSNRCISRCDILIVKIVSLMVGKRGKRREFVSACTRERRVVYVKIQTRELKKVAGKTMCERFIIEHDSPLVISMGGFDYESLRAGNWVNIFDGAA